MTPFLGYQFERVEGSDEQIRKLYQLLKKRTHSISHVRLPNYSSHVDFVKNHPYLHWFTVNDDSDCFGSFYIKNDNSIGLNVIVPTREILSACVGFIKTNFSPKAAQASVISSYFYINVPSSNQEFLDVLNELEILPLQISFRI